ncbi:hypothetical protein MWN33_14705 [Starkeya koreensis]|uniref:Oxidoreductase n=1 Tax=Ancylobacter koreensis TaxID=266121 RepID=A0ABT0DPT5_9HYPH|nr:hypothetical protein [Ancylobacter koreensis]MCK0209283.1 hypothetical protein [Ancylobacter koreensis]
MINAKMTSAAALAALLALGAPAFAQSSGGMGGASSNSAADSDSGRTNTPGGLGSSESRSTDPGSANTRSMGSGMSMPDNDPSEGRNTTTSDPSAPTSPENRKSSSDRDCTNGQVAC